VGGGCVVVLEKGRWWPGCGVFAEYLGPSVCIQCGVVSTAPSRAVKSPCVIWGNASDNRWKAPSVSCSGWLVE
jgi:hypothetical protein